MEDWMLGPPLLIGDHVACKVNAEFVVGRVRWLGRLPQKFGQQMVAGIELVRHKRYPI